MAKKNIVCSAVKNAMEHTARVVSKKEKTITIEIGGNVMPDGKINKAIFFNDLKIITDNLKEVSDCLVTINAHLIQVNEKIMKICKEVE